MTSPRPRLLILSFSSIATDARVLKQVTHFVRDYDVTTCGYGDAPAGVSRHLRIPDDASAHGHSRNDLVARRYRHRYWTTAAVVEAGALLATEPAFDIVLANDVDTVGLALSLAPRLGVHADIHEYAPRLNEELLVWKLFVAPYVRWMCRAFLTKVTSMTTVGQGIADEYLRVYGISSGIVTNAAPAATLEPSPVSTPLRIVHSGAALRNRRLEEVIAAVDLTTADVTLELFLMPNDLAYLAELEQLAAASERVTIHAPVPYSALIATLRDFDLGIHVIPPVNFNNAWALPNKFFDYVQARLGIIIGPSPEMARTLHDHGLGVVTAGFDARDIANSLDSLTVGSVEEWKRNAHASAGALSAESQIDVWDRAIRAIADTDATVQR